MTGLVSGILILIRQREYLTMPLLAGLGVLGGLLRDCAADPEDIWRFSPFFDLNLWRFLRQRCSIRWCAGVAVVIITSSCGSQPYAKGRIFYLHPEQPNLLMCATAAMMLFSASRCRSRSNTRNEQA